MQILTTDHYNNCPYNLISLPKLLDFKQKPDTINPVYLLEPAWRKSKYLSFTGTEYVRRIEAYFCSLCYKIIRADSSLGSRAVQRHCRSFDHLSHYHDQHPASHHVRLFWCVFDLLVSYVIVWIFSPLYIISFLFSNIVVKKVAVLVLLFFYYWYFYKMSYTSFMLILCTLKLNCLSSLSFPLPPSLLCCHQQS